MKKEKEIYTQENTIYVCSECTNCGKDGKCTKNICDFELNLDGGELFVRDDTEICYP